MVAEAVGRLLGGRSSCLGPPGGVAWVAAVLALRRLEQPGPVSANSRSKTPGLAAIGTSAIRAGSSADGLAAHQAIEAVVLWWEERCPAGSPRPRGGLLGLAQSKGAAACGDPPGTASGSVP